MALATALQYTESNLIGQLYTSIDDSQDNLQIVWRDSITNEYRVPDATTRLVVIDKGSANFPSTNYEIVYLPASSTTANNITTYTSGVVRGLSFNGFSLATGGLGQPHIANAEVGPVDVHYFINCIVATLKGAGDMPQMLVYATESARNTDNASPANGAYCVVTATKSFFVRINGVWTPVGGAVYQNATARDTAIASPVVGMSVYLIDEGYFSDYSGSGWSTGRGTTSVSNATASTTGVSKLSVAPVSAGNPIAVGDNDPRIPSVGTMTDLTDGGDTTLHYHASDRARSNHTGTQLLATLLETGTAGETLAAGEYVYVKASDGKLYKATNVSSSLNEWNIVGRIVTGGAANVTVTYVVPFTGSFFFTSGLTDGAKYYLGTGGALTTTRPATNSSSVIPLEVGTAAGTTVLVYNIFRIPREVTGVVTVDGSTLNTLTIGFPVKDADFNCVYSRSNAAGHSLSSSVGRYANASNYCAYAWGYSAGASSGASSGVSTSYCIYIGDITDGTGNSYAVAAVDGSNNITLTWTPTTFASQGQLIYKVTEAI